MHLKAFICNFSASGLFDPDEAPHSNLPMPQWSPCLWDLQVSAFLWKCLIEIFHRARLDEVICPKCRGDIIGRASDMENFLLVSQPAIFIWIVNVYWNCGHHGRHPHSPESHQSSLRNINQSVTNSSFGAQYKNSKIDIFTGEPRLKSVLHGISEEFDANIS